MQLLFETFRYYLKAGCSNQLKNYYFMVQVPFNRDKDIRNYASACACG